MSYKLVELYVGIIKIPEVFFKNFTGKHLYESLCFNKVAGLGPATLFKKEIPAQIFFCEFCKIFKNNCFL